MRGADLQNASHFFRRLGEADDVGRGRRVVGLVVAVLSCGGRVRWRVCRAASEAHRAVPMAVSTGGISVPSQVRWRIFRAHRPPRCDDGLSPRAAGALVIVAAIDWQWHEHSSSHGQKRGEGPLHTMQERLVEVDAAAEISAEDWPSRTRPPAERSPDRGGAVHRRPAPGAGQRPNDDRSAVRDTGAGACSTRSRAHRASRPRADEPSFSHVGVRGASVLTSACTGRAQHAIQLGGVVRAPASARGCGHRRRLPPKPVTS